MYGTSTIHIDSRNAKLGLRSAQNVGRSLRVCSTETRVEAKAHLFVAVGRRVPEW